MKLTEQLPELPPASEPPDRRDLDPHGALSAALAQVASALPGPVRQQFLDRLVQQFPDWGRSLAQAALSSIGGATAEQWNDPAALAARLAELRGDDSQSALSDGSLNELRRQLSLPRHQAIDPQRTIELTLQLIEFVRRLETFVNGVWQTIGKNLGGAPPPPIVESFGRFLSGPGAEADADVALTTLDRRARVMIATLRAFSRQHAEKFAPAEIESAVDVGFLANKAKACWEKYVELCGGSERDALEAEILSTYVSIISRIYLEHRPTA